MGEGMKAVVVGGGPVGAVMALFLLRYTGDVTIVERRADPRCPENVEEGRSINLVLTSRGLYTLEKLGLRGDALALSVAVEGRGIHTPNRTTGTTTSTFQPYGITSGEVNYSVSRNALNNVLLTHAEKRGVKLLFSHKLRELDLTGQMAYFDVTAPTSGNGRYPEAPSPCSMHADVFFAADGVHSRSRRDLVAQCHVDGDTNAGEAIELMGLRYKELLFPPVARSDGNGEELDYSMNCHALHIWPNGVHFLMGLANKEKTFTGTIFFPDGSGELAASANTEPVSPLAKQAFDALQGGNPPDTSVLEDFVKQYYPELPSLVPDYLSQLVEHVSSPLTTVSATTWHYKGRLVLVGDAAHGITPFFGQGLNIGLESALMLDACMRNQFRSAESDGQVAKATGAALETGLEKAFAAYQRYQRPSSEAMAFMAKENFTEMAYKTALKPFQQRKKVEKTIEAKFPTLFRSRYFIVTQTLIPFATVQKMGASIDACIQELLDACVALADEHTTGVAPSAKDPNADIPIDELPESKMLECIEKHITSFLHAHGISLDNPMKCYEPVPDV